MLARGAQVITIKGVAMKAGKKKSRPRMKAKCYAVEASLDRLHEEALKLDVDVRVSYPRCCTGNVATLHIMFDFHGERILNWWPGTGKTYSFDGQKGLAHDVDTIIAMASQTADRHPNTRLRALNE